MAEQKPQSYDERIYKGTDAYKVTAQNAAASTAHNWRHFNYEEVPGSRGESVFVIDMGEFYLAGVLEGLGTKNLVADAYRGINSQSNYWPIAQCNVATRVNDLVVSGARPMVMWEHVAAGETAWFADVERGTDLNLGTAAVCNEIGIVWAGGESPTLPDIIVPDAAELSGFLLGEIKPKERYVRGDVLQAGDAIVLVESSGMHANGYSSARDLAKKLPDEYATLLEDGTPFGEALLKPTIIYSDLVQSLLDEGLEVHRMEHITGHGWRKLMRSERQFTYRMHQIPDAMAIYEFIQRHLGLSNYDMFDTYNMGAGLAIYLPPAEAPAAINIAEDRGRKAWDAGVVEEGPKQVVIEPLDNLVLPGSSINIR